MRNAEFGTRNERPRLSDRTFYGVIVAGLILGIVLAAGAALFYLKGDRKPDARRIWGDVADSLVVPVAVMVGGTFGAIGGLATAIGLGRRFRRVGTAHHASRPGGQCPPYEERHPGGDRRR